MRRSRTKEETNRTKVSEGGMARTPRIHPAYRSYFLGSVVSLGPRLVWSFPRPAARSLPSHPRPSGAPRAPSLRVGHPPRGPSATLVASRWRVFRLRREPTTPVRLASSLATLVPPGRRALRAAYGESDEVGCRRSRSHRPFAALRRNRAVGTGVSLGRSLVPTSGHYRSHLPRSLGFNLRPLSASQPHPDPKTIID